MKKKLRFQRSDGEESGGHFFLPDLRFTNVYTPYCRDNNIQYLDRKSEGGEATHLVFFEN